MAVIETVWIGSSLLSLVGLGFAACCCGGTQQQQQQILNVADNDGESKRICPDCGIENPKDASYCGDCGFSFKTGDDDE